MDELVLVVPRAALPGAAAWYGLTTDGLDGVRGAGGARGPLPAAGRDGGRPVVEAGDPVPGPARRRGLVPDAPDPRRRRRAPARPVLASASAAISTRATAGSLGGLRREWAEEVVADFEPEFRLVALLNDDTTEVGAVHLGAVFVGDAAGRPVAIRETDKLEGRFAPRAEVRAVADRLETWSRSGRSSDMTEAVPSTRAREGGAL